MSVLGERALAGAGLEELAADAVEQLAQTLPLERAELRVAGGEVTSFGGAARGDGQRFELGPDDALIAWFGRAISDDEASFVRAVAGILGTGAGAPAQRGADAPRGAARSADRTRQPHAAARPARACAGAVGA